MATGILSPSGYPADWRITSRCTLACDFCYGPVPGNDQVQLRSRILESLKSSSVNIVTFCGGEPLVVKEIGEYAAELRESGKKTVLNTNGPLLCRRISEGMQMAFNVVGLSLDGSSEDVHRQMRGQRADFQAALDAARIIRTYPDVKLKIATVISQVNREDLPALARLVRDIIKPDVWRLYQYSEIGPYNRGQARHRIPTNDFAQIVQIIRHQVEPIIFFASTAAQQGPGCLLIGVDGTVFQARPSGDVMHGNCLETPLDQIWRSLPAAHEISENKRWHSLLKD